MPGRNRGAGLLRHRAHGQAGGSQGADGGALALADHVGDGDRHKAEAGHDRAIGGDRVGGVGITAQGAAAGAAHTGAVARRRGDGEGGGGAGIHGLRGRADGCLLYTSRCV